jgi:MFS transporter, FSR family, fosmidomycin resistance protein
VTGGTIGYALSPLLFAPFVEQFGLHWTPILALPGLVFLAVFLPRLPPVTLDSAGRSSGLAALRPYQKPLFLLYAIVVCRTLVSLSFSTFVPVMLTRRGMSVGAAGAATALFLFTGGIGGLAGGPLADRFGPRRVIALSLLAAAPLLASALMLSDWKFLAVLAAGGFFLQFTLPVNITYAHTIAPVSAGTVSSLMMGVAWGTGGMCAPLVGLLADRIGIATTLGLLSAVLPVGAALVIPLPPGPPPGSTPQAAPVGISEPT